MSDLNGNDPQHMAERGGQQSSGDIANKDKHGELEEKQQ